MAEVFTTDKDVIIGLALASKKIVDAEKVDPEAHAVLAASLLQARSRIERGGAIRHPLIADLFSKLKPVIGKIIALTTPNAFSGNPGLARAAQDVAQLIIKKAPTPLLQEAEASYAWFWETLCRAARGPQDNNAGPNTRGCRGIGYGRNQGVWQGPQWRGPDI